MSSEGIKSSFGDTEVDHLANLSQRTSNRNKSISGQSGVLFLWKIKVYFDKFKSAF